MQNVIDRVGISADEVRSEVRRCIDTYAPGGGYTIYGASVQMRNPDAWKPDGALGALVNEVEFYGKDYYKAEF